MSTEETLLPCPFCGSPAKAKTSINTVMGWVECSDGKNCRMTGPWHDTSEAAIAAWNRRAGGERERGWQPIETAPKDGTTIWAVLHHDLYPGVKTGRKDLEHWNGLQVPLRHLGIYESDGRTWDHGWNIAAPVGHGGFPDEWIAGWRPIPAPPRAALAGQTEGERNGG